jgi:8-hydroxy-5-deazaflavin:NADPH oxidoreductase
VLRLSDQPIPIIGGTGSLGFGLALRWAAAGLPVTIGSRDAGRAQESAGRLREKLPDAQVEGVENAEAATRADIVVMTVPFRNQSENLTNLKEVLTEGQILVDSTVPLAAAVSGRATRLLGVPQGSAAEQAQEMVPDGVTVVSALHTVSGAKLGDLDHDLDEDVPVMGDKREPKKRVADLIARIDGLRPINAGLLETARLVEGLTPLLISVNSRNKTHAGIRFTELPEPKW